MAYQENPHGGGGTGWVNDSGSYTGYGYGNNPYSDWGWKDNYNPWR